MIVSSVSSVLLQGTATTRNSLTTIAAVSTGRTSPRRWKRGGGYTTLSQLASRIPPLPSSTRELEGSRT